MKDSFKSLLHRGLGLVEQVVGDFLDELGVALDVSDSKEEDDDPKSDGDNWDLKPGDRVELTKEVPRIPMAPGAEGVVDAMYEWSNPFPHSMKSAAFVEFGPQHKYLVPLDSLVHLPPTARNEGVERDLNRNLSYGEKPLPKTVEYYEAEIKKHGDSVHHIAQRYERLREKVAFYVKNYLNQELLRARIPYDGALINALSKQARDADRMRRVRKDDEDEGSAS